MKKVVCLALLSLSALGAPNVVREELHPGLGNVNTSGSLVAWIRGAKVGFNIRIDGLENEQYVVLVGSTESAARGVIGTLATDGNGRGRWTGFMDIDSTWDDDDDNVIHFVVTVFHSFGEYTLHSDVVALQTR